MRKEEDIQEKIKIPQHIPEEKIEKTSESNFETTEFKELIFEREKDIPEFEKEKVYELDRFDSDTTSNVEKLLAPPPNFQETLSKFPSNLKDAFKSILNAEIVGIWPVKQDILKK